MHIAYTFLYWHCKICTIIALYKEKRKMQAELHLLQYKFVCYRICPALANKICITPLTFWQKRGTLIKSK